MVASLWIVASTWLVMTFFIVGGYDGRNYLSTIERYNELESRWQIVCEMMEQRCTFGLAENHRNDGFFVFGGFAH
jgi:hypothetical protein